MTQLNRDFCRMDVREEDKLGVSRSKSQPPVKKYLSVEFNPNQEKSRTNLKPCINPLIWFMYVLIKNVKKNPDYSALNVNQKIYITIRVSNRAEIFLGWSKCQTRIFLVSREKFLGKNVFFSKTNFFWLFLGKNVFFQNAFFWPFFARAAAQRYFFRLFFHFFLYKNQF